MLTQLLIRDFVIVDRLALDFSAGFGALTGETGAGKSILIDALSLALGERADSGVVRAGCERAEIAATFSVECLPGVTAWLQANDFDADAELILRRVVDAGGRSRAYINGSPAAVQQLREVGEWLVDIHGQHAHQSLLKSDAQRDLFDAHAGLQSLREELAGAYRHWRSVQAERREAEQRSAALAEEREQLAWQLEELDKLALGEDEWSGLDQEHRRLAHAASLVEGAQMALSVLAEDESACLTQIGRITDRLNDLSAFDPALAEIARVLDAAQAELSDAVSGLRRYADRVDIDPARFAEVERRIEAVMGLARRFRVTPEALPALQRSIESRLATLTLAADPARLEVQEAEAWATYDQLAETLTLQRQAAAPVFGDAVSQIMRQLALASGRFEVVLVPFSEPGAAGREQIELRIAGLAGSEPRPLAKVASGGELSRISLAIQVVAARSAQVPTLIFDEVDVGIGGGVAEIVGHLLHRLGEERQVLCVTHLPQVAARADWQWQVSKSGAADAVRSEIRVLDESARVQEIARMLGGVDLTEITLSHAREMLRSTA